MYCSQCGHLSVDNAKFCVQCGVRFQSLPTAEVRKEKVPVTARHDVAPKVTPPPIPQPAPKSKPAQLTAENPKASATETEKTSAGQKIFFSVTTVLIAVSIILAMLGTVGLIISAFHGQVGPQHVFLIWPIYYGVKWLNRWRRGKEA